MGNNMFTKNENLLAAMVFGLGLLFGIYNLIEAGGICYVAWTEGIISFNAMALGIILNICFILSCSMMILLFTTDFIEKKIYSLFPVEQAYTEEEFGDEAYDR